MLAWFFEQQPDFEADDTSLSKSVDPPPGEDSGAFEVSPGNEGGFDMDGGGGSTPEEADPKESKGSLPPTSRPELVSKKKEQPPQNSEHTDSGTNQDLNHSPEQGATGSCLEAIEALVWFGLALASVALTLVAFVWIAAVFWKDAPILVLAVVAIFGVWLLVRGWRLHTPLRGWIGRKNEVHLQLSADLKSSALGKPADVEWKGHIATQDWLGHIRVTPLPPVTLPREGLEDDKRPYANRLSSSSSELTQLPLLKSGQIVALEFVVGDEVPWEGMLASLALRGPLRFRRGPSSVGWTSQASVSSWDSRGIYLAGPSLPALNQARQSLQRLADSKISIRSWEFSGQMDKLLENPRSEAAALFLGHPIKTSAGYRWRFQTRRNRDDLDIQAEDLPKAFPSLKLLLLQETPVSEMLPRSAADRRQARYLRAFAAEAQRMGTPVVLAIPHLPPKTASRCIEEIAKLLVPYPFFGMPHPLAASDPALIETVDAIRRHIRNDEAMDDEAAWDVVLYSPPGWRNPFQ